MFSKFAGVTPRTIENFPDGTFSLEELKKLAQPGTDFHHTRTALICLENTHNFCGGKALPLSFVKQVRTHTISVSGKCLWGRGGGGDFEADFLCSVESQPQNTELGNE